MPAPHRARLHLETAGKLYPGAWKQYDALRQDRNDLGGWPDYVFCPLAAAYAVVSGGRNNRLPLHLIGDVGRLGAVAAWRPTQGIYRFDPDLYEALVASPLTGELPCELLRHLPAWCVYVEASPAQQQTGFYGFFAHIEFDPNDGREELRLLIDTEEELIPVPLHLGRWDLGRALDEMGREARKQAVLHGQPSPGNTGQLLPLAAPLVSLLLYLCSDGADYQRPELPRPKRTKQGWRLFPADRPTTWEVGTRIGAAIRAGAQSADSGGAGVAGGRASPRPHVRAAHWHLYWTGPRDGERKPLVRWIPPTGVNLQLGDAVPSVARTVKGRAEDA